ncbi:MAG: sigma-70 family RNA polymerase sigma factor, partial [Ignavibacteriae bacterium]|nr:sigma-70 family RNA polymerase sigma factor [Ignavibacteriota bacterium]
MMSKSAEKIKKKKKEKKKIIPKKNLPLIEEEIENEGEFLEEEEEGFLSEEEIANLTEEFKREALPHIGILRNYAYKMTGNELDADDLLQETYLRAFRFFHKFEKGTNCKAWLFRIMKNLFINNYRKNQKSPGKVDYEEIENFFENIKSDKIDSSDLQEKVFANLLDDT